MSFKQAKKAFGLAKIHIAVLERNFAEVARLLNRSKDNVNKQDRMGATPLHYAVTLGYLDIVSLLLSKRASFLVEDLKKQTALFYARSSAARTRLLRIYERLGVPLKPTRSMRQDIAHLLREPEALRAMLARKDHPLSSSVVLRNKTHISIIGKGRVNVNVGYDIVDSTFGFLSGYGDSLPTPGMMVISGWRDLTRVSLDIIPNGIFTELVRTAAKILDFKLWKQSWDSPGQKVVHRDDVGRYLASQ
ncbi:hypothetical protein B0T26DRAFT_245833 [Lasiosphaeria miniovina]|uniref:Ankyrin repeat protein n=1 Tax=Lasiosphaeria miniovina TaxID=1954250 RepID=A0AA40AVY1_9PEZI|nr:uncharacterized protein B0T26DRAFT_245833 [Lasiosphaeria miniovina]KAK0723028.1 hypothetical protein B0T26DRAFT_245833 [Lasiosphaeria miniovina]